MKKYKFVENKPRQETIQPRPNMTTYDPVNYDTFKRIQKMPKVKSNGDIKIDKRKPEKENKHPGPGQYQIVQTWLGK